MVTQQETVREGRPGYPTILHVDDDPGVLSVAGGFLHQCGYNVVSSTSPFLAYLLARYQPEALVLDVEMPMLSGDQVAKLLRERDFHNRVKVIFFSGVPEAKLKQAVVSTGAAGYVQKERGLPALLMMIRQVLTG
jgi:CheY-like chemotaxis protein